MSKSSFIQIPGYELTAVLGKGGMATVYKAQQLNLGRDVAVKIMARHLATDDPSFGERFLREARISGQLKHPNIVGIHDVGVHDGNHYISMEYHAGGVLKDRMLQGVTVGDALRITREIAAGLDFAHKEGFVHRDIKPDNVLFRTDGGVVLMDFGIARAVNSQTQLTMAGAVVGTPRYMSPEQAMDAGVDHRSDLYALGIVLYEMLTGDVPFNAETPIATIMKHINDVPPPLPPEIASLQSLVDALLAKDRDDRIGSGADLVQLITHLERRLLDSEKQNHLLSAKGQGVLESFASTVNLSPDTPTTGSTVRTGATPDAAESTAATIIIGADSDRAGDDDATIMNPSTANQAPAPAAGSRRPLVMVTALVLLLAAGGAGGWFYLQSSRPAMSDVTAVNDPEPVAQAQLAAASQDAQLEELVAAAATALDLSIQAPLGDNAAWQALQQAALLAPADLRVRLLSDRLVDAYARQAAAALAEDNLAAARADLADLRRLAPAHLLIASLSDGIERAAAGQAREQQLADLLATVEQQIAANRLSSPDGDNALETITAAARLAPGDTRIPALRVRIGQRYGDMARDERSRGNLSEARSLVTRGLAVAPQLPTLRAEADTLDAQLRKQAQSGREQALQEQRQALAALLTEADAALAAGRLAPPASANAYTLYSQALDLDATSAEARRGIGNTRNRYLATIESAAASGDLAAALAAISGARAIGIEAQETALIAQRLAGKTSRDRLRSGGNAPLMVFVPAGNFRMGDAAGTGFPQELPVHRLEISRPFLMGSREVTFADYDRFVAATSQRAPGDNGWGRGEQPVINVSWHDATAYTAWLSAETGSRYRLPTEAEWEFAARSNTATEFWWGNSIGENRANCKNCGGGNGRRALPVGKFEPNYFGLYDTVGNVYEWTSSPYTASYAGNDGTGFYQPGSGNPVARGGSWFDTDRFNRASMRLNMRADFTGEFVGFRVLREL